MRYLIIMMAVLMSSCCSVYTANVVVVPNDGTPNIDLDVDATWRVTPWKVEWHSRGMRINERKRDYERTDTAIVIHQKRGDFIYMINDRL